MPPFWFGVDVALRENPHALTQVNHSVFKYLIYVGKMVAGVGFESKTFKL